MKYEWKKEEKEIYLPKSEVQLVAIPAYKFVALSGKGDPNGQDFAERVGVLYSVAYAIRMMPKSGYMPDGYFEYTVYPLEGVWQGDPTNKSSLVYTMMIRQPNFVSIDIFAKAMDIVKKKKPHKFLSEVVWDEREEGLSVQMMHTGSYGSEPISFAKMQDFMDKNGLQRTSVAHREIYLSDPNKTKSDQLKTVLRYTVQR